MAGIHLFAAVRQFGLRSRVVQDCDHLPQLVLELCRLPLHFRKVTAICSRCLCVKQIQAFNIPSQGTKKFLAEHFLPACMFYVASILALNKHQTRNKLREVLENWPVHWEPSAVRRL